MLLPTHRIVLTAAREGQGAEIVYVELGEEEPAGAPVPAYSSDAEQQGRVPPVWQFRSGRWFRNGRPEHRVFKIELIERSLSILRHYEAPEEFATVALREEAGRIHRLAGWEGGRWRSGSSGGAKITTVETLFIPTWGLVGVTVGGAGSGFVGTEPATWLASKSAAAAIHIVLEIRGTCRGT